MMEEYSNEEIEKLSKEEMYYYFILLKARYLSHRDFSEIENELCCLAKSGCLNALSSYFAWQKPELWDENLKNIAKNSAFIDDENNIPEQWELLMNFHRFDSVGVYGYENITNYQELISEFIKVRADFASILKKSYITKMSGLGHVDKGEYFELKDKYDYLYGIIKNRPFTKCLINAQMGYFKRFIKYNRLADYEAGLQLLQGANVIDSKKEKTLNLTNIPSKVLQKLQKKFESGFQNYRKNKKFPIDEALAWSNIKQINYNGGSKIAEKMIDFLAEKPVLSANIFETNKQERVL